MKDIAILLAAVALIGLANISTAKVTPRPTTISTEELHRQVDTTALPTAEVREPF